MLVKTKAIVISTLRYQEKSLIVKCFTEASGLKTYFVRSAFSSNKSSQRIAYFQPLYILEIEAVHKNKGTMENFKEVRLATDYSPNLDIVKNTILLFVSEVLHYSIQEEETNEDLFNYLESALRWLNEHDTIANFHMILLLNMTKFLGFYPDLSTVDQAHFEISEGIFVDYRGITCLTDYETYLFKRLLNLKFSDDQKVFSGSERQILIKILLQYYSAHIEGFRQPKSLDVLTEIFAT